MSFFLKALLTVCCFYQVHAQEAAPAGEESLEQASSPASVQDAAEQYQEHVSVEQKTQENQIEDDKLSSLTDNGKVAGSENKPPQATAPTWQQIAVPGSTGVVISDGNRIAVEGRGFSIRPPQGWELDLNHPTLSLFMQIPAAPGIKYRRTLQVASLATPRYIDEVSAREFESYLVENFSKASLSISNYRIRNHAMIELADKRPAILFYAELNLDGVELMQAHILASGPDRHYLMSYTDLREHFEDDALSSRYLSEAWDAMVTLEFQGATPVRFAPIRRMVIAAAVIGFLLALMWGVRQWRGRQNFAEYDVADQDHETSRRRNLAGSSVSELDGLALSNLESLAEHKLVRKQQSKPKVSQNSMAALDLESSKHTSTPKTETSWMVSIADAGKSQSPVSRPATSEFSQISRFDDEEKAG